MQRLLAGKEWPTFVRTSSRKYFTDGFMIADCGDINQTDLQSHLLSNGIDVQHIHQSKVPGNKWIMLKDDHHCLPHIQNKLEEALQKDIVQRKKLINIATVNEQRQTGYCKPWLKQFDVTHDYKGTFFGQGNWKSMHGKILRLLEEKFDTKFKDNGNSFNSCFQFEEIVQQGKLKRRFKVYNKFNAQIQSRSAQSGIGINTNKLYSPSYVQTSVYKEAMDRGLARMEISYTAESSEDSNLFYSSEFLGDAEEDLLQFQQSVNTVTGLCYKVTLYDLLTTFQIETRWNQLFIRLPNTAAIIYSKNSKKGTYSGYIHDISQTHSFNIENFLAKHALAGPNSKIRCLIMSQGLNGNSEESFYQKDQALCQIPGFNYFRDLIAQIPKPVGWAEHALTGSILNSIRVIKIDQSSLTLNKEFSMRYEANTNNPIWQAFTKFAQENRIVSLKGIQQPPDWLLLMLNDPKWRQKITDFLKHTSRPKKREIKNTEKDNKEEPGSDADETEIKAIKDANPRRIEMQKELLSKIGNLNKQRALDVSAGRGELSQEVLKIRYKWVDMFDISSSSVKNLKVKFRHADKVKEITQSSMQTFKFKHSYGGIFNHWNLGYLTDEECVKFLMQCKKRLIKHKSNASNAEKTESLIFVLDNIRPESEELQLVNNQRWRSRKELESLFKKATLKIYEFHEPELLHSQHQEVMAWALR